MAERADASVYAVTLERGSDGTYLAWVDDLHGCAVRAESKEDVLERLPDAIREFLAWIGAADASTVEVEVEVVEEVDSAVEAEEDTEVLVRADRSPLTREDWERIQRWLAQSRAELLDLLGRLSEEQLSSRREGSERTIREEIEHVAFVELMYALWTFDRQSRQGLAGLLAWTRDVAAARLHALANEQAAAITWADWGGAPRPEPWSPRKAARRLVWHELLHLRAIERFSNPPARRHG